MQINVTAHCIDRWRERVDPKTKAREVRHAIMRALEPGFRMRKRGLGFELVMREARVIAIPTVKGWDIVTAEERKPHGDRT